MTTLIITYAIIFDKLKQLNKIKWKYIYNLHIQIYQI